jgi:hypothetical protein
MKNIYIILIFIFSLTIFSCAKKSETPRESDTSCTTTSLPDTFAPPSWIQGLWTDNISSSSKSGWRFTSSDANAIVSNVEGAGLVASGSLTEHLTSTECEFSFLSTFGGTGSISYSGTSTSVFTKETTSTINLTRSSTTSFDNGTVSSSITENTFTKDTSL